MRVLQVNTVCGSGSTGRITVALHNALRDDGQECLVAYGRGRHLPSVDAIKVSNPLAISVHAGLSRVTDRQGFYSTGATRRLLKVIEGFEPDIIHLHNLHGYYIDISLLLGALQRSGIPVVWTLHDCWAFTGHCAYFELSGCDKWQGQCHNCPQLRDYPASFLMDRSKRNYVEKRQLTASMKNITLITPSEWMAQLVEDSFLKQHRLEVIKNGIDQKVFKPTLSSFKATHNIMDRHLLLGVAGKWTQRKGLQDFIEVSKLLGPSVVVALVGVDAKQSRNLPGGFVTIGKTESASQLAAIYSAADVYFNPTYEDNYPTTNLEAASCGTPVVTYDSGGSGETVTAGRGKVVPTGNLSRAATAIRELCGSGHRVGLLQPDMDQHLMAERYLDLYRRLVQ